jgi:collagenase-like PrtC family protease
MSDLEFSIPCNGTPESLPQIFALNRLSHNRVREVYISGPQEYSSAGRIMPKITLGEFIDVVDRIHEEGIRVNLLINSVCEGSNWYEPDVVKSKLDYIGLLHEKHHVEAITIANPIYIKKVRKNFPKIEINVSVLSGVDSVQRAVYFDDMGVDVIVPDTSVNRDIKLLKQIKSATKARLKLMPNLGCVYKCPFQRFHSPYISHKSVEVVHGKNSESGKTPFFQQRCSEMITGRQALIFQSAWIRPEDLRRYSDITNYFKITGRRNTQWATMSKAYIEESWDGDLLELMDASLKYYGVNHSVYVDNKGLDKYDLFDMFSSCNRNCSSCSYCNELAIKMVKRRNGSCR